MTSFWQGNKRDWDVSSCIRIPIRFGLYKLDVNNSVFIERSLLQLMGFGEMGKKWHCLRRTRKQMPCFEGNKDDIGEQGT